jgi:N6-L-threonylcarbamoyladenine synthase
MKILSIDTSCDDTSAAVTEDTKVICNIIWSQASQHASFGGVMPSLAQRLHKERIDWVINKALGNKYKDLKGIDAIAITQGPGLAIALEVGISKAKELSVKYNKPLIPVNHIEGHLLSSLATPSINIKPAINFPAFGLVVSGGNTQLIYIKKIGKYKVLAQTVDDALGEALDKAARLLGLGYPGGSILEKFAREGDPKTYSLPIPLKDDKVKNRFSYSGLKTAMFRLVEKEKPLTKQKIYDLAASFQNAALEHIIRIIKYQIDNLPQPIPKVFLLGGGVANNNLLRTKLRRLLRSHKISFYTPYSKKICGDNAAMIGITAFLKIACQKNRDVNIIDRSPKLEI